MSPNSIRRARLRPRRRSVSFLALGWAMQREAAYRVLSQLRERYISIGKPGRAGSLELGAWRAPRIALRRELLGYRTEDLKRWTARAVRLMASAR